MQKINAQKPKNNQKPGGKDKNKPKGKQQQQKKPIEEEYDEDQLDDLDDLDDDDIDMFADDIDKDSDLFWKLEVTHNEPSTMDVPENFDGIVCITQASFGESVNKGSRTVVCCTTPLSNEPVPICVLTQGTHETHPLNLKFSSPSEFSLKGQQPSTVYLTGYVEPALDNLHDMDDDVDYDIPEHMLAKMKRRFGEEDDEEEDEAEQFEPAAKKRKIEPPKGKKAIENKKETPQAEEKKPAQATGKKNQNQKKEANKKPQTEAAKPQTEAPKTPEAPKTEAPQSQTPQDKQNTTTSTEAAANNNEADKTQTPQSTKTDSAKLSRSQKRNLKKKQANGKQTEENKPKEEATKEDNKPKEEKPQTETSTSSDATAKPTETPAKNGTAEDEEKTGDKQKKGGLVEKKLPNGIEIKDIKLGNGAEIKNGQSLHIMYAGQLANKTVFDKHLTGSGFSYKFGSEEGIKGWHLGMKGMKVGGKRRITIPAKFAFGADGNPAKGVPGDATVTYTIEVLEEPKQ